MAVGVRSHTAAAALIVALIYDGDLALAYDFWDWWRNRVGGPQLDLEPYLHSYGKKSESGSLEPNDLDVVGPVIAPTFDADELGLDEDDYPWL